MPKQVHFSLGPSPPSPPPNTPDLLPALPLENAFDLHQLDDILSQTNASMAYDSSASSETSSSSSTSSSDSDHKMKGSDNSKWTAFENGAIWKLRKDGASFTQIAKTINRERKEVKERYNFCVRRFALHGTTVEEQAEAWAAHMEKEGNPLPQIAAKDKDTTSRRGKDDRKKSSRAKKAKKHHDEDDDDEGEGDDDSDAEKKAAKKARRKERERAARKNEKRRAERKARRTKRKSKKRLSSTSTSSSSSSSSSSTEAGKDNDQHQQADLTPEQEAAENRKHIYHSALSDAFPDQKTYAPSPGWTADDCKVLAVVEARLAGTYYQRVQAEFCNATGRMVPLYLLKAKMGAAEDPK